MNKSQLMKNKKGLVMGVANERSIAWAIAKELSNAGAEVALSYQGETLKKRIYPLAKEINSSDKFSSSKSFKENKDNDEDSTRE